MILTINAGSSSVRLAAFTPPPALACVAHAHHGDGPDGAVEVLRSFLAECTSREVAVIAHRVVHGGDRLTRPCIIDAGVEAEIERLVPLAPLHNSPALGWIRACRQVLGDEVKQVAVFDTAFYAALPESARRYALPRALSAKYGLRRYGFHGLAHQAMWERWRELRPGVEDGGRVVSLQLGAGCSVTAVRKGRPLDTSMGFSPLEGLVMATRSGDVDAGLITYLQRHEGLGPETTETMLNRESGLLGMAGDADMEKVLAREDADACLAVEVYCHRARKYLGAFLAVLGGADGVLFGGGVGENAAAIRARILQQMEWAGIVLDTDANHRVTAEARVSSAGSEVEVWVLPVDEAKVLARTAAPFLAGEIPSGREGEGARGVKT